MVLDVLPCYLVCDVSFSMSDHIDEVNAGMRELALKIPQRRSGERFIARTGWHHPAASKSVDVQVGQVQVVRRARAVVVDRDGLKRRSPAPEMQRISGCRHWRIRIWNLFRRTPSPRTLSPLLRRGAREPCRRRERVRGSNLIIH